MGHRFITDDRHFESAGHLRVHANVVSRYSARQTASSRLAARGDAGGEPPDMFCVHTQTCVHAKGVRRYSARHTASSRLAARGDAGGEPPDIFCVHTQTSEVLRLVLAGKGT